MADTLTQKMRKAKKRGTALSIGGQTGITSGEEVQSLSAQKGLAPPTSPAEGSVIGATPDQAKMLGTAQQKGAAMEVGADLGTALRTEQARTSATAAEEARQEKSKDLEKLGGLGQKVESLIDSYMPTLAEGQEVTAQVGIAQEALDAAEVPDKAAFSTALEAMSAGNDVMNNLVVVANQLGLDYSDPKLAEALGPYFQGGVDQVKQLLAESTEDDITMSDDIVQQLGYDTLDTLASDLGMDPGALGNLSLAQFQDIVNQEIEAEYNQVESLKQNMLNPNLSPAERSEARRALRDMGAIGMVATEADMDNLQAAIDQADEVDFGGKTWTVEELLSDENISLMTQKVLEDEAYAEELRETEADFVRFIEENKAALDAASSEMESDWTEFEEIQQVNKDMGKFGASEFSDEFMKELIPGFGTFQSTEFESPALLDHIKTLDPVAQNDIIGELNNIKQMDPDAVKQLAGLDADQIKRLGIGTGGKLFERWKANKVRQQEIKGINDYKALTKFLGVKNVNNLFQQAKTASYFGKNEMADNLRFLDANGDGKLDSPDEIRNALLGRYGNFDLQQASENKIGIDNYQKVDTRRGKLSPGSMETKYHDFVKDGSFTYNEVDQVAPQDRDWFLNHPNVPDDVKNRLGYLVERDRKRAEADAIIRRRQEAKEARRREEEAEASRRAARRRRIRRQQIRKNPARMTEKNIRTGAKSLTKAASKSNPFK